MLWAILAVVAGLAALVWSAERFIEGAAATARHFGMSPLLIGMVIVGFGTSAPEMVVSDKSKVVPGSSLKVKVMVCEPPLAIRSAPLSATVGLV